MVATVASETREHHRRLSACFGAPEPHDFAVRVSHVRPTCPPRPPHPRLTVRDDRPKRPSSSRRDAREHGFDLPDEAIHSSFFLPLYGLLRFARNDDKRAIKTARRANHFVFELYRVNSPAQKYSSSKFRYSEIYESRPLHRGAFRERHERGVGCDGRGGNARRAWLTRTAKSCGPDAPTLVSSWWMHHSLTTVAKAAGHRGEHEVSC